MKLDLEQIFACVSVLCTYYVFLDEITLDDVFLDDVFPDYPLLDDLCSWMACASG